MEYVLLALILVALIAFVTAPLRRRGHEAQAGGEERLRARVREIEVRKEAKYREIRDAELDYRMGKLSEADWRATDRELRAEAIVILRRLDELT